MSIRNLTTVAMGWFLITLSGTSGAWTINENFDSQAVGDDCGSFDYNEYPDTKVTSDNSTSGGKSCKMTGHKGSPAHGAYFTFPTKLTKGGEFWMRMRIFMPAGYDYGIYSSGEFLKFMGVDTYSTANNAVAAYYLMLGTGQTPYSRHLTYDDAYCGSYSRCHQFFGTGNDKPQLGKWETYEMYMKFDNVSVDDGGTGRVRLWKNGLLVGDLTELHTMNNAADYVDLGRVLTYWNGGPSKTQHLYLDDLVATNVTPGGRDAKGNPYIGVGNFVAISPPLPPSSIQ